MSACKGWQLAKHVSRKERNLASSGRKQVVEAVQRWQQAYGCSKKVIAASKWL